MGTQPQEDQNVSRKVFQRDTFEVSQPSKNREALIDKMKHTVVQSAASFSDTRTEILKGVREEKGQYGYSEIEQRHEDGHNSLGNLRERME